MRVLMLMTSLLAISSVLAAETAGTPPKDESATKKEPALNNPAFHAKLLEIAADYSSWARADNTPRFSPMLCRMPPPSPRSVFARVSASDDSATHGQKLYFLFAKDAGAYLALSAKASVETKDAEQVIVKESWSMKEASAAEADKYMLTPAADNRQNEKVDVNRDIPVPFAKKDGNVFHAEDKLGLYIMYKLDPKTADTDEGWVYGTVSADGKTVTSAGRVQSCMNCHVEAPHGRLFGLKPVEK